MTDTTRAIGVETVRAAIREARPEWFNDTHLTQLPRAIASGGEYDLIRYSCLLLVHDLDNEIELLLSDADSSCAEWIACTGVHDGTIVAENPVVKLTLWVNGGNILSCFESLSRVTV